MSISILKDHPSIPNLEEYASSISSFKNSSLSLPQAYKNWRTSEARIIASLGTATGANGGFISGVKSLYRYLNDEGFEANIWQCKGLKGKNFTDLCHPLELLRAQLGDVMFKKNVTHGIVTVNMLVIDPYGYLRFGPPYPQKDNYPLREVDEYWVESIKMDNIVDLKSEDIAVLMRKHNLGKDGGVIGAISSEAAAQPSTPRRVLKMNRGMGKKIRIKL